MWPPGNPSDFFLIPLLYSSKNNICFFSFSKITIAAFSSGSVIITGARQIRQINDCYNFINNVFRENYSKVKKISAPFFDEKKEQRATSKKYIKPSDIIYIDTKQLDNEYNSAILKEYLLLTNIELN